MTKRQGSPPFQTAMAALAIVGMLFAFPVIPITKNVFSDEALAFRGGGGRGGGGPRMGGGGPRMGGAPRMGGGPHMGRAPSPARSSIRAPGGRPPGGMPPGNPSFSGRPPGAPPPGGMSPRGAIRPPAPGMPGMPGMAPGRPPGAPGYGPRPPVAGPGYGPRPPVPGPGYGPGRMPPPPPGLRIPPGPGPWMAGPWNHPGPRPWWYGNPFLWTLPAAAMMATIAGVTYYVANGIYYRPYQQEGTTVYVQVEAPR